jgi:hypothetical protein
MAADMMKAKRAQPYFLGSLTNDLARAGYGYAAAVVRQEEKSARAEKLARDAAERAKGEE